ncbi:hypothetical protein DFH09DRAFT_1114474 [Mycena vulgaris]|nr:hypothetical protein DFH09DRAFT_1114474 [Mycena vulgaris]
MAVSDRCPKSREDRVRHPGFQLASSRHHITGKLTQGCPECQESVAVLQWNPTIEPVKKLKSRSIEAQILQTSKSKTRRRGLLHQYCLPASWIGSSPPETSLGFKTSNLKLNLKLQDLEVQDLAPPHSRRRSSRPAASRPHIKTSRALRVGRASTQSREPRLGRGAAAGKGKGRRAGKIITWSKNHAVHLCLIVVVGDSSWRLGRLGTQSVGLTYDARVVWLQEKIVSEDPLPPLSF